MVVLGLQPVERGTREDRLLLFGFRHDGEVYPASSDSIPGVPIVITPRAVDVLWRALEAGRMDPARVGVRVSLARGMKGSEVRTGFAEEPEPGDETLDAGGIRVFIPEEIASGESVLDVADEHDRIVLRAPV